MVTAKRKEKEITRNTSHFKHIEESHMTGVEAEDESDNETVSQSTIPPRPSHHRSNGARPTPDVTAVENQHGPQTPPRPQAGMRGALHLGMGLILLQHGRGHVGHVRSLHGCKTMSISNGGQNNPHSVRG